MVNRSNDFDVQPEPDVPASGLISLSLGLILGCGMILGALLGGLAGHFLLNDAFGSGGDIVVGAIVGALVIAVIGVVSVRALSSRA